MSQIKEVDAATLADWMSKGEALLIDVREPAEYGFERIPGALLMPLASFDPAALPRDSARKLVLHCGTARRSGMAAQKMIDSGLFSEVLHLAGGIAAWKQAQLPLWVIVPSTGALARTA
ncbi:rhodanese-like domain-containing protein [Novispirillum sp. DQ9]|uniref:rhodanese-like domain-containing protein n=1 Tax=Novispirillum sp. DQ9 TaxID=3398612 RepID=UPI003C7C6A42